MRASEAVSKIPTNVVQAFMSRLPPSIRDRVALLQNPTDELRGELVDAKARGKGWSDVAMFAQNVRTRRGNRGESGKARVEENFFYSSRRFPGLANNTIGAGALVPGAFSFFTKGVDDQGDSMGFPTGFVLGPPETNLEVGGSIPQGTSFVFNQLGISFNSDIDVTDLSDMLDAVALGFSKAGGQFSLAQGPLKMWPAGMGISGMAAVSATGETDINVQAVHNGAADIRAVKTLRIPRILRENETFKYSFLVARGTKAKNGATIGLSDFVVPTIWLFGGQRNVISG
jgi:hypothetical protein